MKERRLLHRFRPIRQLYRDAGMLWLLAEDRTLRKPFRVQWLGSPNLAEDVNLARQQEALQALWEAEDDTLSEWKLEEGEAILVKPAPPGRALLDQSETQRDEIYLEWLRQGLERLQTLHESGLIPFSFHRDSWWLKPEEDGGESLVFCDLGIFSDSPCSSTLPTAALLALPPEVFSGSPIDGRADLYGLASVLLRQRHSKVFEKLGSFSAMLDFHLGGRMAELVPKTPTPLNQILRRLLQVEPAERPESPAAALAELSGAEPSGTATILPDWSVERLRRRQATLVFGTIQRLLEEGNPRGLELLEACPASLRESDLAAWSFLQVAAARDQATSTDFFTKVSEAEAALAKKADPRLEILLDVEIARRKSREGDEAAEALADRALKAARQIPEEEVLAKALGEKAKRLRARGAEAEALPLLEEAWELTAVGEDAGLRESLGLDLMQVLAAAGENQAAFEVIEGLRSAGEGVQPERMELSAALLLGRLGRGEAAKEEFYRAKSRYSAKKDVAGLVWACAHELRFLIETGEREAVLREYRLLKNRSRGMEELKTFMELLELKMALAGVAGAVPPENSEDALDAVLSDSEVFHEWLWSSAESWDLWADYAQQVGRTADNEKLESRAELWRADLRRSRVSVPHVVQAETPIVEMPVKPEAPLPQALPKISVQDEKEIEKLREDNKSLRERVHRLENKISELRRSQVNVPAEAPSETSTPELAALREAAERRSIAAALRRHNGNRIKAAQDLKIHRRTLFEKIRRYDLSEADYMPSLQEVRSVLEECRGRKGQAAEKLGMSRSTFYRWIKSLGASPNAEREGSENQA